MPLTSTVSPPLTLPLTVPVTNSPDSREFSSEPRRQALGLVTRQDRVAIAVLDRVGWRRRRSRRPAPRARPCRSEPIDRDETGLEAGVDDDEVGSRRGPPRRDHLAERISARSAGFLEQGGKRIRPWDAAAVWSWDMSMGIPMQRRTKPLRVGLTTDRRRPAGRMRQPRLSGTGCALPPAQHLRHRGSDGQARVVEQERVRGWLQRRRRGSGRVLSRASSSARKLWMFSQPKCPSKSI